MSTQNQFLLCSMGLMLRKLWMGLQPQSYRNSGVYVQLHRCICLWGRCIVPQIDPLVIGDGVLVMPKTQREVKAVWPPPWSRATCSKSSPKALCGCQSAKSAACGTIKCPLWHLCQTKHQLPALPGGEHALGFLALITAFSLGKPFFTV